MSLQFIIGTAGYDHSAKIIENMQARLESHPNEDNFYIVPNHIKFEAEVDTLKRLNVKDDPFFARNNIQVFSMTRLVWYYLKNHPEYQKPQLSDSGINMLIYQIILDHQEELTIFNGELGQTGFIAKLAQQIAEMQAGFISSDDLDNLLNQNAKFKSELTDKLKDFAIIYREFEAKTLGQYLHKSDMLDILNRYLSKDTVDLSTTNFYISGFSQFTAQERAIVETMIKKANLVVIDLTLDRPYPTKMPVEPNLFYKSARLYNEFYELARVHKKHVLTDIHANQPRVNKDLLKLDQYWQESVNMGNITPSTLQNNSVAVLQTDNNYAEVAYIANQIRHMVATKGYKYADFLVMTRHLDKYKNIIKPIFDMEEIPFFNDVQKNMADHPLVELINALFSIENNHGKNYKYADVMRLLKTEMFIPKDENNDYIELEDYRNRIDLTENLVLKNGYEGQKWLQTDDWQYAWSDDADFGVEFDENTEISNKINSIRHFIKDNLPPFYKKINAAQNGIQAATILYEFMVNMGVPDQLNAWRNRLIDEGKLEEASRPEQVWNTFCNLLDDYVTVLGNNEFKAEDFLSLLQAGFEGASYNQIPSTLDQVAISESGIVQMNNRKVVFMMGSTDDVMPDHIVNDNLFNDDDRDALSDYLSDNQYLSDTSERQMADDQYLNYLSFLVGSEKLIFSFSANQDEDNVINLSPYVDRIAKHFKLDIQNLPATAIADADNVSNFVGTYRSTLRRLVQASQDSKNNHIQLSKDWIYIFQKLSHNINFKALTEKLLGGLYYRNAPTRLKPEIITKLYGNQLSTSISKLEQFYSNPYEYFLKYGLKLQERSVFDLSPANTGQFYHEAMDRIMRKINAENIDLARLSAKDLKLLVTEVTQKMLENTQDFQYAILQSSHRMEYIKQQLVETIQRTLITMHEQSKYTPMRPRNTEISFGQVGQKNDLKPLKFVLSPDEVIQEPKLINVRGRIDRVDVMNVNGRDYVGIVDYKSSQHKLEFGKIYDGTSMQMLTYLDVLAKNLDLWTETEKAALAGAVYMHINNPKLTIKEINKSIEDAFLNKQKYSGILVNNDEFLNKIDRAISDENYGSSKVFPIRKKKDGSFYKSSPIVEPADLDLMIQHNEDLIKKAGHEIFSGNIDIAPAKWSPNNNAMQYTPYKSIMQFDPLLTENNYREVNSMGLAELIKRLRTED
ncbi:PD-(D/E)XK nuclease family protein [Apilactobacillus xinyiensis]|uniref:PD-(D/E)XK nuclease family protein n=1 Tax=Apilactobacillus xinyiensis TaxID=2841032 RepID=UPI003364CDEE